jgi:hypothetical protein
MLKTTIRNKTFFDILVSSFTFACYYLMASPVKD